MSPGPMSGGPEQVRWVAVEFNSPATLAVMQYAAGLEEDDAVATMARLMGALSTAVHLAGIEPATARRMFSDSLRKAGPVVAAALVRAEGL